MKIGIISDIHGYPEKFKKAAVYFDGCDMVLCAGDIMYHGPRNPILDGYNPAILAEEILNYKIPMLVAKGNCDAEVDLMVLNIPVISPFVVYEKNDIRFIVTHGHELMGNKLREVAQYYKADIVVSGHTHIRMWEKHEGILYINPGSISIPKGDNNPSIAVFEDNTISFINIETGKIIDEVKFDLPRKK